MLARIRGHLVLPYGGLSMVFFFLVSLPVMLLTGSAALPDGPLSFASNHESALGIWALPAVVPRSIRFIAKQELFDLPVFGHSLALGGHIAVDRRSRLRAVASPRRAGAAVRGGTSLIVFPEGTRSRTGRVLPFKTGPFVVAMEAGVPVAPVASSGAGEVNPAGRIGLHPGVIRIAFGAPVSPADCAGKEALLTEVRHRVMALHRAIGGAGGDDRDLAEPGEACEA